LGSGQSKGKIRRSDVQLHHHDIVANHILAFYSMFQSPMLKYIAKTVAAQDNMYRLT
jgi:hypothetical protein